MQRVTGIGGVFFKSRSPARITAWYQKHLGLPRTDCGVAVIFSWREAGARGGRAETVWAPFPARTRYFRPSKAPYMINYRVRDLDGMLRQLGRAGVKQDGAIEESEFGRFAWIMDPEGRRIELWQPPRVRPRPAKKRRGK